MKVQVPVARRYARALFGLAADAQASAAMRADMAALGRAVEESPDLQRFLADTMLARAARERTIAALFQGRVQPLTWRFLRFLEAKQRLGLLGEIARAYEDDEEARSGVLRGALTAAIPLDEGRVQAVAAKASAKAGRPVVMAASTDPRLIGGFRLRIGDTVYDYSLAARLRLARAALAEGRG